jgi:hypothetical protein
MTIDADSNQTPSPLQRMHSLTGAEKEEDRPAGLLLDSPQVSNGDHSIDQVLQIFETLPTYAVAVAKMHADLDTMRRRRAQDSNGFGAPGRLTYVVRRLDRRASTFLALVFDVDGQKAFEAILDCIWRLAWEEFTGWPIERLKPAAATSEADLATIVARVQHWSKEGYQRLGRLASIQLQSEDKSKPIAAITLQFSKWEDVEIFFLSDFRVEIGNGKSTESFNFGELGLADRRSHNPNQEWEVLRLLAECDGKLSGPGRLATRWAPIEKRVERLRKRLQQHFCLSGDPLPFRGGAGYTARFTIGCRPAYKR